MHNGITPDTENGNISEGNHSYSSSNSNNVSTLKEAQSLIEPVAVRHSSIEIQSNLGSIHLPEGVEWIELHTAQKKQRLNFKDGKVDLSETKFEFNINNTTSNQPEDEFIGSSQTAELTLSQKISKFFCEKIMVPGAMFSQFIEGGLTADKLIKSFEIAANVKHFGNILEVIARGVGFSVVGYGAYKGKVMVVVFYGGQTFVMLGNPIQFLKSKFDFENWNMVHWLTFIISLVIVPTAMFGFASLTPLANQQIAKLLKEDFDYDITDFLSKAFANQWASIPFEGLSALSNGLGFANVVKGFIELVNLALYTILQNPEYGNRVNELYREVENCRLIWKAFIENKMFGNANEFLEQVLGRKYNLTKLDEKQAEAIIRRLSAMQRVDYLPNNALSFLQEMAGDTMLWQQQRECINKMQPSLKPMVERSLIFDLSKSIIDKGYDFSDKTFQDAEELIVVITGKSDELSSLDAEDPNIARLASIKTELNKLILEKRKFAEEKKKFDELLADKKNKTSDVIFENVFKETIHVEKIKSLPQQAHAFLREIFRDEQLGLSRENQRKSIYDVQQLLDKILQSGLLDDPLKGIIDSRYDFTKKSLEEIERLITKIDDRINELSTADVYNPDIDTLRSIKTELSNLQKVKKQIAAQKAVFDELLKVKKNNLKDNISELLFENALKGIQPPPSLAKTLIKISQQYPNSKPKPETKVETVLTEGFAGGATFIAITGLNNFMDLMRIICEQYGISDELAKAIAVTDFIAMGMLASNINRSFAGIARTAFYGREQALRVITSQEKAWIIFKDIFLCTVGFTPNVYQSILVKQPVYQWALAALSSFFIEVDAFYNIEMMNANFNATQVLDTDYESIKHEKLRNKVALAVDRIFTCSRDVRNLKSTTKVHELYTELQAVLSKKAPEPVKELREAVANFSDKFAAVKTQYCNFFGWNDGYTRLDKQKRDNLVGAEFDLEYGEHSTADHIPVAVNS